MASQHFSGAMQGVEEGTYSKAVEEPNQETDPGGGNPCGAGIAVANLACFPFI